MPVLGLTGGVATGKSTFARLLLEAWPIEYFDADRCVHDLLATDDATRDAIVAAFGGEVCDARGRPDRARLRELVFADQTRRETLEAILHPTVRQRWQALASQPRFRAGHADSVLVDIPLLYETGTQAEFDRVIVVAASRETQFRRLTDERGLAPSLAEQIMAAQLDLGEKTRKADHVIWNDSTVSNLDGQTQLLAAWLSRRFA